MIKGGIGGNTTLTGLNFEKKVDLITLNYHYLGWDCQNNNNNT